MKAMSGSDIDLSYDSIYSALKAQSRIKGVEGEDQFDATTRTMRNRARFIAECALDLPHEDRRLFVDRKVRSR